MFLRPILMASMLLATGNFALQTYDIDNICLNNTIIHIGTETVLLNITTDFTKYTKCDAVLEFMDRGMIVKFEVFPLGSEIKECGWMTFVKGAPHFGEDDVCMYGVSMTSSWRVNMMKQFDNVKIRLDGSRWVRSGVAVPRLDYTLSIHGYYHVCDMPTDSCRNTKEDCEDKDCMDGDVVMCNLYCHYCTGKQTCCDSYGQPGENTDSVHVCTADLGRPCIHKNMTCDNYTNCEDESDEMCGVTVATVADDVEATVADDVEATVADDVEATEWGVWGMWGVVALGVLCVVVLVVFCVLCEKGTTPTNVLPPTQVG